MNVGLCLGPQTITAACMRVGSPPTFSVLNIAGDYSRALASMLKKLSRVNAIDNIILDVSGILQQSPRLAVTSIRIAPRKPLDHHNERREEYLVPNTVIYVCGGHNSLGGELVQLDESAVRNIPQGSLSRKHVTVSAVGALINPEHEQRVEQLLWDIAGPASVVLASSFTSTSFRDREYTAIVNTGLLEAADQLSSDISDAARLHASEARLFFATNDGGCLPLRRLPLVPVFGLQSREATTLGGAAHLAGVTDGRVVVGFDDKVCLADFADALPVVRERWKSKVRLADSTDALPLVRERWRSFEGPHLATSHANVLPVTASLLSGSPAPRAVVQVGITSARLEQFGLSVTHYVDHDPAALGAATAPLSYWYDQYVTVRNARDIEKALADAQRLATARLVASGTNPSIVRVSDSRVMGSTYGESQVVRIRVRATAPLAEIRLEPQLRAPNLPEKAGVNPWN
ncbi:MAG: hypothetical protein B5766_09955 [Candidatus Lumbricidophila eiseniae]|uniref:Hydantoinase/oxoprolinase N-terminal domain-containing protein n=1 Tax=Candidatus Lumbricidiphila eiseniae TaxID=1969409 RepID=A0A2A6FQL0_9MICO|nr:MAG: hypothetical protein B5766_09955 [Candidatus Lumbricidophila eiseniae]